MKKILNEWRSFVNETDEPDAEYNRAKTNYQRFIDAKDIRGGFRYVLSQLLNVLPQFEQARINLVKEYVSRFSSKEINSLWSDLRYIQTIAKKNPPKQTAEGWPLFTFEKTREGMIMRYLGPPEEIPTMVFDRDPVGMAVAADVKPRLTKAENIVREILANRRAEERSLKRAALAQGAAIKRVPVKEKETLPRMSLEQVREYYFNAAKPPKEKDIPPVGSNPRWGRHMDYDKRIRDTFGDTETSRYRRRKKRKERMPWED